MKRIWLLALIVLVCLFPSLSDAAEQDGGWKKLDHISDQALRLAKNGQFEEAKEVLLYFSEQFFATNARDRLKSADELRAVTITHENALKTVTASSLPAEEKIDKLTQFRLVVDAIHSNHQPLWSEMESTVMETFDQLEKAVDQERDESFAASLRNFLNHYELIEPSVKIDVPVEEAKKIDKDIEMLQAPAFRQLSLEEKHERLKQMREDLQSLFDDVRKDEADPSLIWVMISTGGIIILTLSYVGWRKYQGEKEKSRTRQKEE
ncbi:sporulation protein YpjB [Parageobacillus genomosp. 1]|jgi:sporulation protein YpjB|uniref:Sporulation protein YpjB n=1 Tax=Parageobacillus genomosp. 1 TaxID=1295642 RepID=A0ABC9VC98_9BACL|nr:sporulation protein YpjB [Parageobacillus genomosp. 1]EZP75891.1 sporulation protein YpjB [Parageobacillus genomosp. 1]